MRAPWSVAAVLLLLAACGAPDAASPPTGDAPSSRTTGSAARTGSPATTEAQLLLQQASSHPFQVSYEMRGTKVETPRIIVASSPPAFSWREDDAAESRQPTLARHLIQVDASTVVGCIWVGADVTDPAAWECARSPVQGDSLFAEFFGGLLFGGPVFDAARVTDWDPTRHTRLLDRDVVCGTSSGFAPEVTEVCLDSDTGVPLSLTSADSTYTATAFGTPAPDAFTPPDDTRGGAGGR